MKFSPKTKAATVTSILTIFFAGVLVVEKIDLLDALPFILFYVMLLLHTYYSIRNFSEIPYEDVKTLFVDGVLVCFYVIMVLCMGDPVFFCILLSTFFVLAALKYVILLGHTEYVSSLKRKIIIDAMGAILGLVTLFVMYAGYVTVGWWFLVSVYLIATVYCFLISPLYTLER
ncbi:MAG: hypothetical protein WCV79_03420 [Candidatus Paceibacterota bacterium]|jgi:hypothetical protein